MTHKIKVSDNNGNAPYIFDNAQWRIRSDGNLEVFELNGDAAQTQTTIAVFKNWDSVVREVVESVVEPEQDAAPEILTTTLPNPIRKTRGTK